MNSKIYTNLYLFVYLLFYVGYFLSFTSGYGSDEDTLPMIGAFGQ